MPKPHVIVVADAADAMFFEQPRYVDAPRLIHQIENPAGRRRTSELTSDRIGYRSNPPVTWQQAAPQQQTDPVEMEEERFAREIAQFMEGLVDEGRCSTISLFTPPSLLGRLRKSLSKRVGERVTQEQATDLTNVPPAELVARLQQMIPPRPLR